jgi:subtilisin family serine protease
VRRDAIRSSKYFRFSTVRRQSKLVACSTTTESILARSTDGRDGTRRPRAKPQQQSPKPQQQPLVPPPEANDPSNRYDSNLRLALALIEQRDWYQLAARTGILWNSEKTQYLSLFVEIDRERFTEMEKTRFDQQLRDQFELHVPAAYVNEFRRNPELSTIAVRIPLNAKEPSQSEKQRPLQELLKALSEQQFIRRLRIAIPHGQCLQRSLAALDLPVGNAGSGVQHQGHTLEGADIVIGIIDDGCAFAHPDFLEIATDGGGNTTYRSRVLALWDQSQPPTQQDVTAGWKSCDDFGFGRELSGAAIDNVIAAHSSAAKIDEDRVYDALRYAIGSPSEPATHGTRVMGIAAGNGSSATGWPGVAPKADIIFVQLPPYEIEHVPQLLSNNIVHGVHYVFERALALGKKAAVVNVSYGGYSGPHDGTTPWEKEIDQLLALENRAVVVSGGNGFEADCHAMGKLGPRRRKRELRWNLKPRDTTVNALEIWYTGSGELEISLRLPDGESLGPFAFCAKTDLKRVTGEVVGSIEHFQHDPDNGDNSVLIALGPTAPGTSLAATTNAPALAPSGDWIVTLRNRDNANVEYHAWIQRDDVARPAGGRQQSRFAPEDAAGEYTISDFAGGKRTISVGAFNAATDEVSSYSACGPTRASTKQAQDGERTKPDLCAPGEELATGGGILTAASRAAMPHRMNGTSAAAPHVTGIIALIFDYRRNHQAKDLTADQLRTLLSGQRGPKLRANRRAAKQRPLLTQLTGEGKISCARMLQKVDGVY